MELSYLHDIVDQSQLLEARGTTGYRYSDTAVHVHVQTLRYMYRRRLAGAIYEFKLTT